MLFSFTVLLLVGLLFIWLGILIWKKGKISLIHAYHYTKVKEEDKKAYTSLIGKSIIIIGIGIILTEPINYITKSMGGWMAFTLCFAGGFLLIGIAQKKYNGGFF